MPSPLTSELPKPLSWDEFEDIVWDIYIRKWNDPDAQRYGRTGQAQQGVDIFGRPQELDGDYVGIQCKRYEPGRLTREIVKEEIKKAESFKPPLTKYIIATTDNRDSGLQEAVRLINQEREQAKNFSVRVVFWEDLSHDLTEPENRDLLAKHYGEWLGLFRQILTDGDFAYYPIKLRAPLRRVFDPLIEDRMRVFGGRGAPLSKIASFIQNPTGGYLVVTAPAGFGKTALMSNLVKGTPDAFAYHFFTSRYGDSLSEAFFLENVVQQMAQWHGHMEELPSRLNELQALYQHFVTEPLEGTQVLVLDGLDEVQLRDTSDGVNRWELAPYLSRHLPDHLHIIVTVRDVGQDWRAEYELPDDQVTHLPLDGLARDEIKAVLMAAGGYALSLANDPQAVDRVAVVCAYQEDSELGADPFYVRLLAEDAAAGRLTAEKVADQPRGLEGYLDKWWQQIKTVAGDQPTKDLFGTLTAALGPMGRSDLEAINPGLVDDWAEDRFDDVLSSVRRFVTVDDKGGYALFHPRLHRYLRTQIKTGPYLDKLLAYCARWPDHKSRYALTHYARHLVEAGDLEGLYGLISQDWMEAKLVAFHSHRPFSEDVALAVEAAGQERPPNWVRLIRGCLIYATLGWLATNVPPEVMGALGLMGQIDKALGYAALIQDMNRRSSAHKSIVEGILERGAHHPEQGAERKARQELGEALAVTEAIEVDADKAEAVGKVAQALAQAGMTERLKQALAAAEAIQDDPARARALGGVAQALSQVVMRDEAQEAANRAFAAAKAIQDEEAKEEVLGEVAQALAYAGMTEAAFNAVGASPHERVKAQALGKVARALAQVGAREGLADALASAESIQEDEYRAWALADVAQALNQVGIRDWAQEAASAALTTAKAIQDEEPKDESLRWVAQALAQAGMAEEALDAMEAIPYEWSKAEVLGEVARALAQAGMSQGLEQALAAAEDIDEGPRARALSGVARALAQAGMKDEAAATATSAVAAASALHWSSKAEVLGEVAWILAWAGMVDEALRAAWAIPELVGRTRTLGELAQALSEAGMMRQAESAAAAALAAAEDISHEGVKVRALGEAARALARAGMTDKAEAAAASALAVAGSIQHEWYEADALVEVARALAQTEMVDESLAVAGAIRGKKYKAEALVAVAKAMAQIGLTDQASAAAVKAEAAADTLDSGVDKVEVLAGVAQALAQAGRKDQAAVVAAKAGAVAALRDEADGAGMIGMLIQYLVEAAHEVEKGQALGQMARVLAQAGMAEESLGLARAIRGEKARADTLGEVTRVLIQAGLVEWLDEALAVAGTLQEGEARVEALSQIARALAQAGMTDQAASAATAALTVAEAIQDERPAVHALGKAARALAQAGMTDQAVSTASKALAAAEDIQDARLKTYVLGEIAQSLDEAGMADQAVSTASKALAAAEDIQDARLKAYVLGEIARSLAEAGMTDQAESAATAALAAAGAIADEQLKAHALGEVALALTGAGMMDQAGSAASTALAVVGAIQDEEVNAQVLSAITQALNGLKPRQEAYSLLPDVFTLARMGGRRSVYQVLAYGSQLVAAIDRGQTLWQAYQAVMEVESWWG